MVDIPKVDEGYGLLTLRRYIGDTQGQFAKRLGVTQRAIQAYEHNEYHPSEKVMERVLALRITEG